ncbi:uncharacterized protein LOC121855032 [Homarus americanus]|uniref:uncharacterized protein LOC121855032 n=1 Tax=Homarus americanus TaxID=6706 RepID=UPI001C43E233|nr:uncharacterized protein LOC121855032 [Homarus americanus]
MSPLPQRRFGPRRDSFHGDDERETLTVGGGRLINVGGGRLINVGLFRHLPRFPFSQTVPVPASRMTEARTTCIPEQRRFVRPQLFGEMTPPKRRGIHFGPPRNPQCSCDNCRSWTSDSSWQVQGSRLRAWSLTNHLCPETRETRETSVLPSSFPGTTLSRANSNVSDSATHSHVGSTTTRGKQP